MPPKETDSRILPFPDRINITPPKRRTRRQFLENFAILTGAIAVAVSGADYLDSSSKVAGKVDTEEPQLLDGLGKKTLDELVIRLSEIPNPTIDHQSALINAQSIIAIDNATDTSRNERAAQLQDESDKSLILGIITRGNLRVVSARLGIGVAIAGVCSKLASKAATLGK